MSVPSLMVKSLSSTWPLTSTEPAVSAPEMTAPSSRVIVRNGWSSSGARRASTGTTCDKRLVARLSPELGSALLVALPACIRRRRSGLAASIHCCSIRRLSLSPVRATMPLHTSSYSGTLRFAWSCRVYRSSAIFSVAVQVTQCRRVSQIVNVSVEFSDFLGDSKHKNDRLSKW